MSTPSPTKTHERDESLTHLLNIYEDTRLGVIEAQKGKADFEAANQAIDDGIFSDVQRHLLNEIRREMKNGVAPASERRAHQGSNYGGISPILQLIDGLQDYQQADGTLNIDYDELAEIPFPVANARSRSRSRLPIRFDYSRLPAHASPLFPENDLVHGITLKNKKFTLVIKLHRWFTHRAKIIGNVWSGKSVITLKEEVAGCCWLYDTAGQLIEASPWSTAHLFPTVFEQKDVPLSGKSCHYVWDTEVGCGFDGYYLPAMTTDYKVMFKKALSLMPKEKDGLSSMPEVVANAPELHFDDSGMLNTDFYAPNEASQLFGKMKDQDRAIENALFDTQPTLFGPLTINTPYLKVIAPSVEADEVTVFMLGAHRNAKVTRNHGTIRVKKFDRDAEWHCRTFRQP